MAEVIEVSSTVYRVTVDDSDVTVNVLPSAVTVELSNQRGPQGAPGQDGAGSTITRPAGESIGGHRVVRLSGGQAYYADQADTDQVTAAIGVTTGAASAGTDLEIVAIGEVTELSWNWTTGLPLYLIGQGQLSHTLPATGAVRQIAIADSATTIIVLLQPEIRR